ncbi:MAG: hypothetical protein ACK4UO_14205 [Pseudolabrys sp.]
MSVLSNFLDILLDETKTQAGNAARDILKSVTADSAEFKAQAEANTIKWTTMRASGQLNDEEFASLMRGQVADATLAALLQANLAGQEAAALRDKVIKTAIKTAFNILL